MEILCRICLNTSKNSEYLTNDTEIKGIQLRDMLESFMPEMNLDISIERVVLCTECCRKLEIAYFFKEKCWSTEQRMYKYLEINNIQDSGKISLIHMIKYENGILETDELVIKEEPVEKSSSVNEEMKEEGVEEEMNQDDNNLEQCGTHKVDLKRSHSCDQCEYKAYRLDLLNRHIRKKHPSETKDKLFKCHLCCYSTNRKRHLHRHYFTHNKESPHICSLCSKSFAEKSRLTLHMMHMHAGGGAEDKGLHKCEHCNKCYVNKSYLKEHLWKHCTECSHRQRCIHHAVTPRRGVKCYECMQEFCDKRSLTAHLATYHKKLNSAYNCANCNFKTNWKKNLIRHVQNNQH